MKLRSELKYYIKEVEDMSTKFSKSVKHRLCVLVEGCPSVEDLKIITQEITNNYIKSHNINLLSFHFMDNEKYMSKTKGLTTLGTAVYCYKGNVSQHTKIKPGEYKDMGYDFSSLREKDWNKQPSEYEIKIWDECTNMAWENYELLEKKYNNSLHKYEGFICESIADKNNLSQEKVEEIWEKINDWSASGM